MPRNTAKKFHINLKLIAIIIVIITIVIAIYTRKTSKEEGCLINTTYYVGANVQNSFKHNYVIFKSQKNKYQTKLVEINGWLLLEAVMKKSLKIPISPELANTVKSFRSDDLFGFWPQESMQNGKPYFLNEPFKIYYDSDDTAWGYRYYGNFINESILKTFLSDKPLSDHFYKACIKIDCNQKYIIRVWNNVDWRSDIDIVVIADVITMLNMSSNLSKKVFDDNKKLINFIVENEEITNYFKYFEPNSAGYFLLLFYDHQGPNFLTEPAKKFLIQKFKDSFHELSSEPLSYSELSDDDCTIIWSNEHIPKLMQQYAKRYWNIY